MNTTNTQMTNAAMIWKISSLNARILEMHKEYGEALNTDLDLFNFIYTSDTYNFCSESGRVRITTRVSYDENTQEFTTETFFTNKNKNIRMDEESVVVTFTMNEL